jgi:hypothetical protein
VALRGPQNEPLAPNTIDELRHHTARLHFASRSKRYRRDSSNSRSKRPGATMLAQITGIGVEAADMLVH